jgi:hypothetical protein
MSLVILVQESYFPDLQGGKTQSATAYFGSKSLRLRGIIAFIDSRVICTLLQVQSGAS